MSVYIDKRHIKNKDKWSQPKYKVQVEKDILVKMRDGSNVLADIYRPDSGENEKFPALLAIAPFGKDVQEMQRWLPPQKWYESPMWDGNMEAGDIDYIVSRGYVFVLADPKGVGNSDGEYVGLLGSLAQDGYDLVEWVAVQDWCDGNVGMTGICIYSAAQLLVAGEQPPHLKAIAPFEVWGDVYRSLAYHGGILFVMQHSVYKGRHENDDGWTFGTVESTTLKTRPKDEINHLLKAALDNPDIKYNPKFYSILKYPKNDPIFFDFLLNTTDGAHWDEMSPHTRFDKINIPVYASSPWSIEIFIWNLFNLYENVKSPSKKIFLWPPGHVERPYHEFHDELIRWFDFHLKGIDTGIMDEPPIKLFVMGENKWRYEEEWPLARTQWKKFYLHPYGRLIPSPPTSEYEPAGFTQEPPSSSAEIKTVEYTTPPFSEETEITGPIAFHMYASIDSDDTNFMVDLLDIDPSGNATEISRGYLKASHRAVDQTKSKPYKPFHPHKNPEPVEPGKVYEYAIELMPIAMIFKVGHAMRLVIRNQDNMLDRLGAWGLIHLPLSKTVSHNIYHDKNHLSHLVIPIIPSSDESSWLGDR